MSRTPRRTPHSQRLLLMVLAFVLVAGQALALTHRVVHSPVAQAGGPDTGPQHWAKALFASHDDDNGCRLLDGVGHQAPPVAALVLAVHILPLAPAEAPPRDCPRAQPWAFQARGPPALR